MSVLSVPWGVRQSQTPSGAAVPDVVATSSEVMMWFGDFEEFFHARAAALVRLAHFQLLDGHAAEDVVAEVLSKVAVKWRRIGRMRSPDAYIRRMVVNECVSHQRRASSRFERRTDPGELPDVPVVDHAVTLTERDGMWQLLGELTVHQRTVLVLRYYERVPDEEIALTLDITRATVRSHAFHALKRLRVLVLQAEGEA